MKAIELTNSTLADGRAYYIDGDDLFWVRFAIDFFVSLVPEEYQSLNLKVLDTVTSINDIDNALNTFSMFPCETVVIVKGAAYKDNDKDKAKLEALTKTLDNAYLVIIGKNIISNSALRKAFTFVDAARLSLGEISGFIKQKYANIAIHPKAAATLIERCNRDMSLIHGELTKLHAYKGGGQITQEDVLLNVADNTENELYELSNALALRNNAKAYEIMDKFLASGTAYPYMLAALASQYRRMLYASLSPLTDTELAKTMGAHEYAIKKSREAASKYTKARLKDTLDILTDAEYAFKSGLMSDETAFKSAVSKLLINY